MTDSGANTDLNAPVDTGAITPEQATSLLDQMTKDYRAAHPDPLGLSPEQASVELAKIAKAAPEATEGGLSPYKTLSFAAGLSEVGIPLEAIAATLAGDGFTAEDVAWAQTQRARLLGDQEFIAKYLKGDREAVHWMTAVNAIISTGAAEAK
jgi:hypothetical protein